MTRTATLGDDELRRREAAAHAGRYVLGADPDRIAELAAPLINAIRGEDGHYAGEPQPASAAVRALAQAWSTRPKQTSELVEELAATETHV